jgi:hypothetical protein
MKEEALKIIKVIGNLSNRENHIDAIDRMIETFNSRWKNTKLTIEFDYWIEQFNKEKEKFLTRIRLFDSSLSSNQIKNMKNFNKYITPQINLQMHFGDEPFVVRFIPSGWSAPQAYHVIREYGSLSDSDYVGLMYADQIKERYGFDINLEGNSLHKIIIEQPNDQSLGNYLRNLINSLTQKI